MSFWMNRYAKECLRLLGQYKTVLKVLGDDVPSLEAFVSEYRVSQLLSVRLF
jgi:ESCRT-I complex subunit VPS28